MKESTIAPYRDYGVHPLNHEVHDKENNASLELQKRNEQITGPRFFIGPEAYSLSDAIIKNRIYQILEYDCKINIEDVQVSVKEGDVIISGVVPEDKIAEITMQIERSGARDIQNRLRPE